MSVKKLAEIAKDQQAKLIHISTDYVFDGKNDKLYTEADETYPINVYGKTKLAGEQILQEVMSINAIIIRASWVYSEYGNNFVKTMLKLGKQRNELSVVSDQIGSPTYATDLANLILEIIQRKIFKKGNQKTEIYHYSNKCEISWYELAKEILSMAKIDCKVKPIMTDQYPTPAQRPMNTLMSKDKITQVFSVAVVGWKISLNTCITLIQKEG